MSIFADHVRSVRLALARGRWSAAPRHVLIFTAILCVPSVAEGRWRSVAALAVVGGVVLAASAVTHRRPHGGAPGPARPAVPVVEVAPADAWAAAAGLAPGSASGHWVARGPVGRVPVDWSGTIVLAGTRRHRVELARMGASLVAIPVLALAAYAAGSGLPPGPRVILLGVVALAVCWGAFGLDVVLMRRTDRREIDAARAAAGAGALELDRAQLTDGPPVVLVGVVLPELCESCGRAPAARLVSWPGIEPFAVCSGCVPAEVSARGAA